MKVGIIFSVVAALGLAACTTTMKVPVPQTRTVVLKPPLALNNCPRNIDGQIPPGTSQKAVGIGLKVAYEAYLRCQKSLDEIYGWADRAEKIEKESDPK